MDWTWPAWFLLGFSNGLDLGVALGSPDELELDFNLTYLFFFFDWNLLGLGVLLVFSDGLGRYLDCWTDSNWDWSLGCGLAY